MAVAALIAPWSHEQADMEFGTQRALEKAGRFGDTVRSLVEVAAGPGFGLQNEVTQNRELVRVIAPSVGQRLSSEVVRRDDFELFLLKDHLTSVTYGRQSILGPQEVYELFCKRVDVSEG